MADGLGYPNFGHPRFVPCVRGPKDGEQREYEGSVIQIPIIDEIAQPVELGPEPLSPKTEISFHYAVYEYRRVRFPDRVERWAYVWRD